MTVLQVSTRSKREIVDLTRLFQKELPQIKKANGLCHLFLLHTTAALTTADLDPGTDLDLLDAFDAVVPPEPPPLSAGLESTIARTTPADAATGRESVA